MKRNFESHLINLVLVFIGVTLFVSAQSIKVGVTTSLGGDFVPKIVTGVWMVVSILLFIQGLRETGDSSLDKVNGLRLLFTFILMFFYIGSMRYLGFVLCSMIYLGVQIFLIMPEKLRTRKNYLFLAIISVVTPILTDLIFVNIFSLVLPPFRLF